MLKKSSRGRALLAATSLAVVLGLTGALPAAMAGGFLSPTINVLSDNGDDGVNVIGDCSPVLMLILAPEKGRNGTCDNIGPADGFGGSLTETSSSGGSSSLLNLLSDNGDDGVNVIGDCSHVAMVIVAPEKGRNGTCDNITTVTNIFDGGFLGAAGGEAGAASEGSRGSGGLVDILSDNGDDGINVIGDCSSVLMLIVAPDGGRNGTCDNIMNIIDGFGGFGL